MLPGAAGRGIGVQHDVRDAAAAQVVRRRQAGLAGADHHRVVDLHARSNTGRARVIADVLPGAQPWPSPASSAISTIRPNVCSRSCEVVSSPVTMWSETVQIASALRPNFAASV